MQREDVCGDPARLRIDEIGIDGARGELHAPHAEGAERGKRRPRARGPTGEQHGREALDRQVNVAVKKEDRRSIARVQIASPERRQLGVAQRMRISREPRQLQREVMPNRRASMRDPHPRQRGSHERQKRKPASHASTLLHRGC